MVHQKKEKETEYSTTKKLCRISEKKEEVNQIMKVGTEVSYVLERPIDNSDN